MLRRSSTRYYRLNSLNNKEDTLPIDFDLFKCNNLTNYPRYKLDSELFVQSVDEYEGNMMNETFFKILGDINKKYGEVAFVSGSFALQNLLKKKSFEEVKLKEVGWGLRKHKSSSSKDVDVFILGDKKEKIFMEIIRMMKKQFKTPNKFYVESSFPGLYNVSYDANSVSKDKGLILSDVVSGVEVFKDLKKLSKGTSFYWRKKLGGKRLVYQFIFKEIHTISSDVFAWFDLDCCKIGWFPGLQKVVAPISFVRSILTKMNYMDLYRDLSGWKHLHRILKYYVKTQIRTSCVPEHSLSYYHVFDGLNESYVKIMPFVNWEYNFGDNGRGGEYYHLAPSYYVSDMEYHSRRDRYDLFGMDYESSDDTPIIEHIPLEEFSKLKSSSITVETKSPYLKRSVGIFRSKKNGNYIYKKRDFKEIKEILEII